MRRFVCWWTGEFGRRGGAVLAFVYVAIVVPAFVSLIWRGIVAAISLAAVPH